MKGRRWLRNFISLFVETAPKRYANYLQDATEIHNKNCTVIQTGPPVHFHSKILQQWMILVGKLQIDVASKV